MRARIKPVLNKLSSLLWYLGEPLLLYLWIAGNRWPRLAGWAWPMVHQPEWQKSTGLNLFLLPIGFVSLHFATKRYGSGLEVILIQNAVFDAGTFGFNKKEAFKNRGTSKAASGGKSAVISVVCFLYHKALAALLMMVCGLNVMEAKAALTGVGVAENPVIFVIRDQWVFTKVGRSEARAVRHHWESARAAATWHLIRWKIGV